jgi:hypothetical protein
MPTATRCFTPIKGRVLRVVALDDCGVPVSGAGSGVVVAAGFTQVQQSAEYETGTEFFERTADGSLCVNQKDPDILKRLNLTVDVCQVDPGMLSTISLVRLLTASESPTGTGFALAEGAPTGHFSLEVWQRDAGSDACADGETRWVYNAWPHLVNPKIGDWTIANALSPLQWLAESRKVSPVWTIGDAWLGSGAVTVVPDHWFVNLTTTDPPVEQCGIQDL